MCEDIFLSFVISAVQRVDSMDEGTLKTLIPKCRLYWSFLFGVGGNFVGSDTGQKQSVKLLQNMVYITNPLPPHSHKLSVQYSTLLWEGGRSERR